MPFIKTMSPTIVVIGLVGPGQDIILICIIKHLRNRCFQPQYHRFRGQNRTDKKTVALEAGMLLRFERPFDPLL